MLLSLREDGLLLPRRPTRTGRVSWQPATYPAVHDFLTNPVYAGAFVFGRTRTEKRIDPTGKLVQHTTLLPARSMGGADSRSPSRVHRLGDLRGEHRPAAVELARRREGSAAAPPREGTALLQGRLRCGKCSRLMQTGYSGTKGNCPRYVCARAKQLYGGEQGCQSIGGRRLEQRVLDEVFAVLQPAALAATGQALTDAERAHAATLHAFELSVERTRYEADRARRQYDAVEPENRLVARTLERALETKLAAQRHAERDLLAAKARRPVQLTDDELAWLHRAGADVRAVFNAPSTTFRERKQLLRAIVAEVVITVDPVDADRGAADHLARRRQHRADHADDQDRRAISAPPTKTPWTWCGGSPPTTTTPPSRMILSRQRRRTGTGLPFTKSRVKSLRVSRGIPAHQPPETVTRRRR